MGWFWQTDPGKLVFFCPKRKSQFIIILSFKRWIGYTFLSYLFIIFELPSSSFLICLSIKTSNIKIQDVLYLALRDARSLITQREKQHSTDLSEHVWQLLPSTPKQDPSFWTMNDGGGGTFAYICRGFPPDDAEGHSYVCLHNTRISTT